MESALTALLQWLILSVIVGTTVIFYQLAIRKKQNEIILRERDLMVQGTMILEGQTQLRTRNETEMRAVSHRLANALTVLTLIALKEGVDTSPIFRQMEKDNEERP